MGQIGKHTNLGGVVCGTENEFRRTIVTRADVRDIGFIFHQDLCASEIAQLENARGRVEKQVLRLYVSVADTLRVDVGEGAEKLVDVQLDLEDGHRALQLVEVA